MKKIIIKIKKLFIKVTDLESKWNNLIWMTGLTALLGAGGIFFFQYLDRYLESVFNVDIVLTTTQSTDRLDTKRFYITNQSNQLAILDSVLIPIDAEDEEKLKKFSGSLFQKTTTKLNYPISFFNSEQSYYNLKFLESDFPLKILPKSSIELTLFQYYQIVFVNKKRKIDFIFKNESGTKIISKEITLTENGNLISNQNIDLLIKQDIQISQAYIDKVELGGIKNLSSEDVNYFKQTIFRLKNKLIILKSKVKNKTKEGGLIGTLNSINSLFEQGFNDKLISYLSLPLTQEDCPINISEECSELIGLKNEVMYVWVNQGNISLLKLKFDK